MSEPFTFTLSPAVDAVFTLIPAVDAVFTLIPALDAVFTLQPAASYRTVAEWIAAEAVLFFDANFPE